jgi:hypothetical protein
VSTKTFPESQKSKSILMHFYSQTLELGIFLTLVVKHFVWEYIVRNPGVGGGGQLNPFKPTGDVFQECKQLLTCLSIGKNAGVVSLKGIVKDSMTHTLKDRLLTGEA